MLPLDLPRSRKRIYRAHVNDAGNGCSTDAPEVIEFTCGRCGWCSGWLKWTKGIAEAKRGIPCEKCNRPTDPA